VIVVVEAPNADEAHGEILDPGTIVFMGDPVPVVESDDYNSYSLSNAIRYYVGLPDGRPHMVRMEGGTDAPQEVQRDTEGDEFGVGG
jgi:hypothetical protein